MNSFVSALCPDSDYSPQNTAQWKTLNNRPTTSSGASGHQNRGHHQDPRPCMHQLPVKWIVCEMQITIVLQFGS